MCPNIKHFSLSPLIKSEMLSASQPFLGNVKVQPLNDQIWRKIIIGESKPRELKVKSWGFMDICLYSCIVEKLNEQPTRM